MNPPSGTLHVLARHLVLALEPLRLAVADPANFRTLLHRLAWNVESLPPEYTALGARVDAAVTALQGLSEDPSPVEILALLDKVSALYGALNNLNTAPDGVDPTAFLEEIAQSLFDLLLVDYLVDQLPSVHSAMLALGIIEQEFIGETDTRPGALISRVHWEEVPKILTDPASLPARVYGWGTNDLEFHRLAGHLLELFVVLNWPAYIGRVDTELGRGFLDSPEDGSATIEWGLKLPVLMDNINGKEIEVGLALLELPPQGGKPAGLILQPLVPPEIGTNFEITEDLKLELRAGTDASSTLGVLLRPPDDISVKYPLQEGTALPEAGFGVSLRYNPPSPKMLLGSPGKTRLEMKGADTSFLIGTRNGEFEVRLEAAPRELRFVISAADLDGFLKQLLGAGEKTIPIALAALWSNRTGFDFAGGAGLEITTHPHWSLGPLRVDRLDLAVTSTVASGSPPNLKASVRTALSGILGPVSFSAEGIGISLDVVFSDGNAGPFDIDYHFTPPNGLGIAVNAGPITGGGFLSFQPDKGRYSGALALSVFGTSVKAVGFLETRLPDGGAGYSFVILVSSEFAPVQLGLGFSLNGVGGLAALHRGFSSDALQAGLRSGGADYLLFPKDVIASAPRILSDLGAIFPPAPGRHVFGPMALITWGTPVLVEAKLGILLELPSPIRLTLLGLITAKLPTKQAAIVELHVAVLGRLDFAARRLAIDASLYDSRIAGFPLTGDMALRLEWGDRPSFVVALGGLNPHFEPPAGFPALQRLTIALGDSDNPRLTCQAYLALTSNTVQFGARAELYAAAAGFNVKGWVGFDCLIQLSPFSLLADLDADVSFRRGTRVLASVHLDASLSGPAPWRVKGKASLSLWLFDVSVHFDVTFGQGRPPELPSADPWPLLQAAMEDPRNWAGLLPPRTQPVAALGGASGASGTGLLEPGGAATLRQKVVPLNRRITRFGAAKPAGPDRFAVDFGAVTMNGMPAPNVDAVTDHFAAAQFEELKDTEKLSRPSFERMDSGITLGAETVTAGTAVGTGAEFETVILDAPWQPRRGPRYVLQLDHQLVMLQGASAGQAPFQIAGMGRFGPPPGRTAPVALEEDLCLIASVADATPFAGLAGTFGKGAALAALASHLEAHPEDAGRLQVIPEYEAIP